MKRIHLTNNHFSYLCLLILMLSSCRNISVYENPTLLVTMTANELKATSSQTKEPVFQSTQNVDEWNINSINSCYFANQIREIIIDSQGDLWTAGPGGVVKWNLITSESEIFVRDNLCQANGTNAIALTNFENGEIWVGTDGYGLFRYKDKIWQNYSIKDGLPGNHIRNLLEVSATTLWVDAAESEIFDVSNWTGVLGKFNGKIWEDVLEETNFYRISDYPGRGLLVITQSTWYPQIFNQVLIYNGNQKEEALHDEYTDLYTASAISPNGEIWLTSEKGVFHFDGSSWHYLNPPWIGKTKNKVVAMAVDNNGIVWFGFSFNPFDSVDKCGYRMNHDEFGVYSFNGKDWRHYTTNDGLVDNKICSIKTSEDGNIWFGSFDKGISKFDGNTWTTYIVP